MTGSFGCFRILRVSHVLRRLSLFSEACPKATFSQDCPMLSSLSGFLEHWFRCLPFPWPMKMAPRKHMSLTPPPHLFPDLWPPTIAEVAPWVFLFVLLDGSWIMRLNFREARSFSKTIVWRDINNFCRHSYFRLSVSLTYVCSAQGSSLCFLSFLPTSKLTYCCKWDASRNIECKLQQPKGPRRTKKTTATQNIVNYYAEVFSLRPPDLLRRGRFLRREQCMYTLGNWRLFRGGCDSKSQCDSKCTTIRTETITNENLEILFRFRFRNGKANKFPHIFFRFRFRNDHVGHAQATTAGLTYEIN